MKSNVNPRRSNQNFIRFFELNEKMFTENNMKFFEDFENFLNKWTKSIRTLVETFVAEVKIKNIPLCCNNEYGVDIDIFNWLPGAEVVNGDVPKGAITMLKKDTTEGEMLETALKLPLSQAIERMTEAVHNDYFNKNLKWLVIYLTDTKDGVPLRLICFRRDGKLFLRVRKVSPDDFWYVDDGSEVGFLSNES